MPTTATPYSEHLPLVPSASEASLNYASLYDDEGDEERLGNVMRPASEAHNHGSNGGDVISNTDTETMTLWNIVAILSTAFSYGCVLTTLFLITLPIECERLNVDHPNIPKSVALGIFVAIAGLTQLISPLVGRLSDTYVPPKPHDLGQRLPYLVLGAVMTCIGLIGQLFSSYTGFWLRYSFAFFLHMIGLNTVYSMMIALIPDQVPAHQTGVANGVLALQLVTGSLFGFGLFHSFLSQNIQSMYMLYTCIVIITTIVTCTHAHEQDAEVAFRRIRRKQKSFRRRQTTRQHRTKSTGTQDRSERDDSNNGGMDDEQWHEQASRMVQTAAKKVARTAKDIVLTPTLILKTMLVDPIRKIDRRTLLRSYSIDTTKHHDFFVVTISRLFYYCGMSVQTFFLYYLHDIINIRTHPEAAVATLSILGQCSGAIVCYPVGLLSDRWLDGRRKPFVYFSCALLLSVMIALIFARTWEQMVILSFILGGANGVYLTMDTSLAVDTLPKDSESDDDPASEDFSSVGGEEDTDGNAQLLGLWGVAAFLGSALGPMIGGPLLYAFGSMEVEDGTTTKIAAEEYSIRGYAVLLSLSALYFMCSAVSLRFIKHHIE